MEQSEAAPKSTNVKDLVIPLAMVLSLVTVAWTGGGELSVIKGQLARQNEILSEMRTAFSPAERARIDAETRAELQRLSRELEDARTQHALFRDYTEGRIGSMPYRKGARP